mmetsp:Transcript_59152/g.69164  ORF Transcript_59152/g.69164 Transcript_59152/m.69164 type:complete len:80 (+) Transcript_59152:572-811(+)
MDTVPSVDTAGPSGYPTSFFECDAAKHSMDYDIMQQQRLWQRKSELDELKPASTHGATEMLPIRPLESRQFDYKKACPI